MSYPRRLVCHGFRVAAITMAPVAIAACGGDSSPPSSLQSPATASLPSITSFHANPSGTFILNSTGLSQVSDATPYQGAASSCPEAGPHTFFPRSTSGQAYTVDLYAPANGVVSHVTTCLNTGSFDKYEVAIAVGTYGGYTVNFDFGMEPAGALDSTSARYACSGNTAGQDNGFYKQFVFVSQGQTVTAGQRIAQLYVPPKANNGTAGSAVLTWPMSKDPNGGPACPNIFSASVEAAFDAKIDRATCQDAKPPATLCWNPGPGENIVGG